MGNILFLYFNFYQSTFFTLIFLSISLFSKGFSILHPISRRGLGAKFLLPPHKKSVLVPSSAYTILFELKLLSTHMLTFAPIHALSHTHTHTRTLPHFQKTLVLSNRWKIKSFAMLNKWNHGNANLAPLIALTGRQNWYHWSALDHSEQTFPA